MVILTHDNQVADEIEKILRLHGRIEKQKVGNLQKRKREHKWSLKNLETACGAEVARFENEDEDEESSGSDLSN